MEALQLLRQLRYVKTILLPPLGFFTSFAGLVFLGSIFILNTWGSVNLDFYTVIIFQQTGRLQRSVGDVAIDAEGLRFNSQVGQIGHSSGAKPWGLAPPLATTLRCYSKFNETSTVKIMYATTVGGGR